MVGLLTSRLPLYNLSKWFESNVISHSAELVDSAVLCSLGVKTGMEITSLLFEDGSGLQHVPNGDEHGVLDGHEGFNWTSPRSNTPVLGGEIRAVSARRRHCCDAKRTF